ncbi:Protein of unknown function (DUF1639) [Melia azedarach]|uniref:Uncharacterized protein n=1 Tax=Melia azedarach TaxID=155640 RepID=A0ACC1Y5J3_MELAZ|nr:Protein of unknown function (DUF1639) [Melia azedarach]
MLPTFPLPSQSVSSSSLPQLKCSASAVDQPITHDPSRQLSNVINTFNVSTSKNDKDSVVDQTSQKTSMASAAGTYPKILWKFGLQRKNIADEKVATNGEEISARDEAEKTEERKPTFPAFSFSLERDKIKADLLAMSSKGSEKTAASFQKNSTHRSSEPTESPLNLTVETSENENQTEIEESEDTVNETLAADQPVREKKKRNFSTFSVALKSEEIEADMLAMGGLKRSRRIKKRPKHVQKNLDDLFPGLRLKYITPDDYRVREC